MNKFFILMLLLLGTSVIVFAENPIDDFFVKIKEKEYKKSYKDLDLIHQYLKNSSVTLNEDHLMKLKEIIYSYYEEKNRSNFIGSILGISLLLPKEQLFIVKPLMIQILEDPTNDYNRFVLAELDYLFNDYDGEMFFKYKHIVKDDFDLIGYLLNNKFTQKKYKTFRLLFISLLNSTEKSVKEKMYSRLKKNISFIRCLNEKLFEKCSDAEKEIEIKKMKDWLLAAQDIEIAFELFFNHFLNQITSLTINNFAKEMESLKKNYLFLERMPPEIGLCLDPFNEKDKGFSLGMEIINEEMKIWFKLNKKSIVHYSTYQLDLLIRSIEEKLREKLMVFKGEHNTDLELFKRRFADVKNAIENKNRNAESLSEDLIKDLKIRIEHTKSEPYKKFFADLLKNTLELSPPKINTGKIRQIIVFGSGDLVLDIVIADGKIINDEKGLNVELSLKNISSKPITIVDEFSLELNLKISFINIDTGEQVGLGNTIIIVDDKPNLELNYISLKPNELIKLKISDLVEKSKELKLAKGKYKVFAQYVNYKGENCIIAGVTSAKIFAEKE